METRRRGGRLATALVLLGAVFVPGLGCKSKGTRAGADGAPETGGASGEGGVASADAAFCAGELGRVVSDLRSFRDAYPDPTQIPRSVSAAGVVRMVAPGDWTSGFPAGSYWLLYEHTGDASWRAAAEAQTAPLAAVRADDGDMADVGFIINSSFGAGYRLTQNAGYRSVLLDGAAFLASRFNATVGATRSWDFGDWMFPVIIDNMMNLEILFRGTALGGDARFAAIGTTHALTTRTNHFRADGSSYHVLDYDPSTGAVRSRETYQGLAAESAWARGQAWGLYGFTMAHRETGDARFLDQATRTADFYTQSPDMPPDGVPYFDFDVPRRPDVMPLRDASAGAIAASGLLELARYAEPGKAAAYRSFALLALRTLSSPAYRAAAGGNGHFLLMHSVGAYTYNAEVDVGFTFADYYYIEALMRCAGG